MANSMSKAFPLFLLPRELRDQIYTDVFSTARMDWLVGDTAECYPTRILFPDHWTKLHNHDSTKLLHAFPALCRASRQLFLESTPHFLKRVEAFTIDTRSTKLLHGWLAQFPNNEGFKAIKDYACYEWNVFDTEVAQLHRDMLTRLTNIEHLQLSFTFPDIVNGMENDKYDWQNEWGLYFETGLTYSPKWYYTCPPEIWSAEPPHPLTRYPPTEESIAQEKAVLQEKLEDFIEAHGLRMLFNMPKLLFLDFEFDATGKGRFRHNLCNALYKWFEKEREKRGKELVIATGYYEDFS